MTQPVVFRLRIAGLGAVPAILDLESGETTIGRDDDNMLILRDNMVSRHHARITCTPAGQCMIVDKKSTNGTLVNDAKLAPETPMPLVDGTVITIGPFKLTVEQILLAVPKPPPVAPEPASQRPPEPPAKASPIVPRPMPEPPPAQPPPPLAPGAGPLGQGPDGGFEQLLPGLTLHSQRLIQYLPDIYQALCGDTDAGVPCYGNTDFGSKRFVSRLLGLFESILLPIEWTVDNFDLFLAAGTAPVTFLNWLANWFEITFDPSWSEAQRRTLLREAHAIYARRGTRWALSRMLEIYLGQPPVIGDDARELQPYTFEVILPGSDDQARRASIETIIDAQKPAHAMYTLKFRT